MKRILSVLLLAASLAAVQAQGIVTFTINMTGPQAGTLSTGTGTGWAYYDPVASTMAFNVTYAGLSASPTSAIYWQGPAGLVGDPLLEVVLVPSPGLNPPFQGETIHTGYSVAYPAVVPASFVADLMAGNTYLTIGPNAGGGGLGTGEIRGQLVPEPTTLSIAGLGLGLVALLRKNRTQ